MINTKELRSAVESAGLNAISRDEVLELIDRLEAAEKDRDDMRALVVMRFDHDYLPQFTQGHDLHEVTEPVTAEHCRWFVAEIERLRADCDALRAKIQRMERQEPVVYQRLYRDGSGTEDITDLPDVFERQRPLYALPNAKGE